MRSALSGVASEELPVGVFAEDAELRDRVCEALAAGGLEVSKEQPACVIFTCERPDRDALGAIRSARAAHDGAATILVCTRARGSEVRLALEHGIDGVLLESELDEALVAVVAVVCAGQVCVPRGQRGEIQARALTTREKQILALVVTGLTNAQIAHRLFLAESTVKSHLSSAFSKLGVSSRYEATNVILDPDRGRGLGIREVDAERLPLGA